MVNLGIYIYIVCVIYVNVNLILVFPVKFPIIHVEFFIKDMFTDENHVDMPGWDRYLTKQAQEHNITHLSVSCFHPKRGAWTTGFVISERQIRDLERIFRKKAKPIANIIHLARNEYKIDKRGNKFGKEVLHACRDVEEEKEHIWISFGGGYVVVGVSELDDGASDRCLNCVLNIRMHILDAAPEADSNGGSHSSTARSTSSAQVAQMKNGSPRNSANPPTIRSTNKRLPNIVEIEMDVPVAAEGRRPSLAADAYIAKRNQERPAVYKENRHSSNY